MRWLIGDIHGCSKTFEALLKEIRPDPAADELWCLGDLVNKGPDSLGVLRRWEELGARTVLGNHDAKILRHFWNGGGRDLPGIGDLFDAHDAERLLARLAAEPLLQALPGALDASPIWLIHAGLHPGWLDLATVAGRLNGGVRDPDWWRDEERAFALNARCCEADGERVRWTGEPQSCPGSSRPWDSWYGADLQIVHGHWAMRGSYRLRNVIGLDSGCVYGGSLTAWTPEEDRSVSIDCLDRVRS